ncbi:peptidase M23 [Micromonospora sp. NPDC049559]|uniref:peptidase M23 n=1 Tax=Micromonospora sp. NPDC049559 TaxID=3155923 RepID=UPI003445142A
MRDDDSLDDKYGAAASTGRTEDAPSSVPTGGRPGRAARLRDRLRTVAARSGDRIEDLEDATRRRLVALAGTPAGSRTRKLFGRRDVRLTLATGAVCCLGFAAFAQAGSAPEGQVAKAEPAAAQSELARRDQAARAATRAQRAEPDAPPATRATTDPDVADSATPAAPAEEAAPKRVDPGPVAGLTGVQMDNAKAIVRTGRDMHMPRRALIIAVATAMQESNLYNLASGVLPESMDYPHQGVGWDHDSVGLFQQRSSSGWGPVGKLMDPAYATAQFLNALAQIPGWQQMPLTDAAQAVQVSAFGWLYAQHEWAATQVVDAIVPGWQ